MSQLLTEYVAGQMWLLEYPVHYAGLDFRSRMTIIRLGDGSLLLHSPCHIDATLRDAITSLGEVMHIVAPGSYHYLHVRSAQEAFPGAQTYICPGIERKQPELDFDWILGDKAPAPWVGQLE